MTQTADAATELAREHDEIDRLATRVATHASGDERIALVHELCVRFINHVEAEERYIYPALRRLLSDGSAVAATQARRDRAVARTIECVERGGLEGDEADVLVAHLIVGVQDHVERHDTVLLPALTDAGRTTEDVDRLGEELHEGILAARQEAERAGARGCGRAGGGKSPPGGGKPASHAAQAAADAGEPAASSGGGTHCRGFRGLLQRIAHGGPGSGSDKDR